MHAARKKAIKNPWQPITFGGAGAFASGSFWRFFLAAFSVGLIVACAIVGFLWLAWVPAIEIAISNLPEQGVIRSGTLYWPDQGPRTLVDGRFLSVVVDPGAGAAGATGDVVWSFGPRQLRIYSVLGYVPIPYLNGWVIELNRPNLEPWWGAWKFTALAGAGGISLLALFAGWALIGLVYALPARMFLWFADQDCGWKPAWRLGVVALMPGALVMSLAILLYGIGRLNLIELLLAVALHLVIGWLYLLVAPFRIGKTRSRSGQRRVAGNPFAAGR